MNITSIALITLVNMVLLVGLTVAVGRMRGKYGIKAPATSGPIEFERCFRAQQNTLENTVLFLPCLWLMAQYGELKWAIILGGIWLFGRILYAVTYTIGMNRGPGFTIATVANALLLAGAFKGVIGAMAT